jgi:hypothetical protein
MSMRGVIAALSLWGLGCVIPAQQSYPQQQGYPQQQQQGYPQQQGYAQQPPPVSCQQNLQCYGSCTDESCLASCDSHTIPESANASRVVLGCAVRNQCGDSDCVTRACSAEFAACAGGPASPPVASAPAQPPPAPSPPAADTSIGLPQLVGRWDHAQASNTSYVDTATGAFAGSSVTAYGERYDIAADGLIDYLIAGVSGGNRASNVEKGSLSFANGFMVITFPHKRVNAVSELRIMSYFTTTDGTTILVTVPARTTQASVHWEDPAYVANFCGPPGQRIEHCVGGETWIRARSR